MKKLTKKIYRLFLPVLGILIFSCDTTPTAEICVSIVPQSYLVKRIAGEQTPVTIMIPPGSGHSTHALTAAQIRDLHNSRLYVKVGHPDFNFEKKHIDPFLKQNLEIMTVSMADPKYNIPGDSHIWLSPRIMRGAAERIYIALAELYPEKKGSYTNNYHSLIRDIDILDKELQEILAAHQGAEFLTLHPAWGYFARDYGVRQVSIRDENKSFSAQRMAELIDYAKKNNIRIIFVQKEYAFEQIDVLAREIGAEVITLDPLSASWLENLRSTGRIISKVLNEQ